jgi:hypothetical protein
MGTFIDKNGNEMVRMVNISITHSEWDYLIRTLKSIQLKDLDIWIQPDKMNSLVNVIRVLQEHNGITEHPIESEGDGVPLKMNR